MTRSSQKQIKHKMVILCVIRKLTSALMMAAGVANCKFFIKAMKRFFFFENFQVKGCLLIYFSESYAIPYTSIDMSRSFDALQLNNNTESRNGSDVY